MSDALYDKVALLLPGKGADNGTLFPDFAPRPKKFTRVGDTKTVVAQSKYYGSSILFDGAGDYLSTADIDDLDLGTGDFCVEFWLWMNNVTANWPAVLASNNAIWSTGARALAIIGGSNPAADLRKIQVSNYDYAGVFLRSTTQLALLAWHHVAVTRSGNTFRLFVNGVLEATATWSGSMHFGWGGATNIGWARWDAAGGYFAGHLNDLRVTRGAARYTENFTPPARLVGTLSGTVTDATGAPAVRTVVGVPRLAPVRAFSAQSDAAGNYSLDAPVTPHAVVCLDADAGTNNALVYDRVIPVAA